MSTKADIRAEAARRLGSYQTITVSADPDVTDSAAQRKVVSTDLYSIDKSTTTLGQANLWCGRYNEGNKVRANSYSAVAKAVLTPPTTSAYTLKVYGYGTSASLTSSDGASDIQAAIRDISSSLASVTVTGAAAPYTIASLPSASVTIELVRADDSDTTGSLTQGLASVDSIRPWSSGLPQGTVIEVLPKYPAHDEAGVVGLNNLIVQALKRLWFIDTISFTSTDPDSEQITYPLSTYPWLKSRAQIIRVYAPTDWTYTATYTVPASAHTLSIDVGHADVVTTASLDGSATAAAIQTAIRDALGGDDVVYGSVSVESSGSTRTVTIERTRYAEIDLTISTGAAVSDTRQRTQPFRFTDGYRLKYDGNDLVLEWDVPWQRGESWYLEVYRPADTWVCPQADYQTLGTTWASSTTGPEHDLDQVVPDVNEVASVVHYLAARQLALYGPGQESKFWREEQKRAAVIAAYVKSLDLPKSNEPGFRDEGLTAVRGFSSKGFFGS